MEKTNLEVKQNRNVTLDYLRVFAMFMVMLDHIAFMRRPEWIGTKLADYAFFKPLSIIQWSGAFGVCIFFLLTGYLFIPSFKRKQSGILGSIRFTLRKLLSLWLPCVCAFAFFFVFQKIIGMITPAGRYWWQFSAKDWIESSTLISFFIGNYDKINITWFLIPLVIFYIFYAQLQHIRIREKYHCIAYMGGVLTMYALGKIFSKIPFFVCCAHYSWFVTLIFAGIILYQVRSNSISKRWGTVLLFMNYCTTLLGLYLYDKRYLLNEPYLVSFIYAVMLFIMLPKLELNPNRLVSFFADISFSVYLLHMCIGGLVMSLFENKMRFIFALCISVPVTIGVCTIFCYLIEKPIRKLLRRL